MSRHGGNWDPETPLRAVSSAAVHITALQAEQYRAQDDGQGFRGPQRELMRTEKGGGVAHLRGKLSC